jgi:uncharacterized integral membrane protein
MLCYGILMLNRRIPKWIVPFHIGNYQSSEMSIKELITYHEEEGQKLILKKNRTTFIIYGVIMLIVALVFYNATTAQDAPFNVKWPFYLLVVILLFFCGRYFKTALNSYKIVFNKINKTILLNDGKLIGFKEVTFILISFQNTVDTHYCYLELVLQNGSKYRITKSDISLKKNIQVTANKISSFIDVPIKSQGHSFSYFD